MEKVEVRFVVDIVGHDEATIMQMYKDWLASPPNNNVQPEPAMPKIAEIDEEELKDKAAIYLEEMHISGDTMLEMNHGLDNVPEEERESFYT